MEQIYYTQCPMGYGLGASNGFQVKRISPGYPVSSDFRHLGMRAYPAGGRKLAPATLRYRRVDGAAEIAWLTPRGFEYETERGLWGRPGGHFAHGVRMDGSELEHLKNWPAGLQNAQAWCRADIVPSRGQPPEVITFSEDDFFVPPTFQGVSPLAEGLDVGVLAKALAAVAIAVREWRTMYLIDHQEKLCERIALITFAFPESIRPTLTFSTFHDRPEELPGFRIQGTTHQARPNRQALLSQGIIIDIAAGVSEPAFDVPAWATTLADWLARRSERDAAAWETVNRFASRVNVGWDESALDSLIAFPDDTSGRSEWPQDADAWKRLAARAVWLTDSGEVSTWAATHGPAWWPEDLDSQEARLALGTVLAIPDAWSRTEAAIDWGVVVARAWRMADPLARENAITELLQVTPKATRAAFLRSVTSNLPAASAEMLIRRLRHDPKGDDSTLLPIQAGGAVRTYLDRGNRDVLISILRRSRLSPGLLPAVLDATAHEARSRPGAIERLATDLTELFLNHDEARTWALRQGESALTWLAPTLRPVLAIPRNRDAWNLMKDRTDQSDRPSLARVFLSIAADPVLAEDAFGWGVEHLLLSLPDADRPVDPIWPRTFLDRTASDIDLIDALFRSRLENGPIRAWIKRAIDGGQMLPGHQDRLDRIQSLVRALKSGIAAETTACSLEKVPRIDQGRLLGMILSKTKDDLGCVLESLRKCWPALAEPDSAVRAQAAVSLARWQGLREFVPDASRWFNRLRWLLERLSEQDEWGESGLASGAIAATSLLISDENDLWALRQWIFDQDNAWRALSGDVRRMLDAAPECDASRIIHTWDNRIDKGVRSARFWELVLNSCNGVRLARLVETFADELRTLDGLTWWSGVEQGEPNPEIREAFVRLAPMSPLPEDRLASIQNWLRAARVTKQRGELLQVTQAQTTSGLRLSTAAESRWRCLEALTTLFRAGLDSQGRIWAVYNWRTSVPIARVTEQDRLRFAAWMIRAVDSPSNFQVEPVAKWLSDSGFTSIAELDSWADLTGPDNLSADEIAARSELVFSLRKELFILKKEAKMPPASYDRGRSNEES